MDALDQLAEAADGRPSTPTAVQVPQYRGIVAGAGLLKFYALLLIVAGLVSMVLAGFRAYDDAKDPASVLVAGMLAVGGVIVAGTCFVWATILRMFAELALAQRDIARNSFRRG